MATSLPYLPSYKNLETLFSKIQSAKVPDKFTHSFLHTTIGLKGTNDRAFIPLLRTMGFIDQSGTPTKAYRALKGTDTAKPAIAAAIRMAYAPLFEADENAHNLTSEKLKSLVAQVAGTDETMTARIVSTFSALAKLADFSTQAGGTGDADENTGGDNDDDAGAENKKNNEAGKRRLRPEFHYNIQVHLPSNGTEEAYLNIFNALRKSFE
jgi:hypothetical protein